MSSWRGTSTHASSCTAASSFYYNQVHDYISDPVSHVLRKHLAGYAVLPIVKAVGEVLLYYLLQVTCADSVAPEFMYIHCIIALLLGVISDACADASYIIAEKVPVTKTSDTNSVYFTYGVVIKTSFLLLFLLIFGIFAPELESKMFDGVNPVVGRSNAFNIMLFGAIFSICQFTETEHFLFSELKSGFLNLKAAAELVLPLTVYITFQFIRETAGKEPNIVEACVCYVVMNALVECGVLGTSAFSFLELNGIHTHLQLKRLFPFKRSLVLLTLLKTLHNLLFLGPEALMFALTLFEQFRQTVTFVEYKTAYEIAAALYVLLARVSKAFTHISNAFMLQFCGINMAQQRYRRISQLYQRELLYVFVVEFVYCFVLYLFSGLICQMILSGTSETVQELYEELNLLKNVRLASFYGVLIFPFSTSMQVLRAIVIGRDTAMIMTNVVQLLVVLLVFGATLLWGESAWVMHNILACALFEFAIGVVLTAYVIKQTLLMDDATSLPERTESVSIDVATTFIEPLEDLKQEPTTAHITNKSNMTSSRKSDQQGSMFFETPELPLLHVSSKEAVSGEGLEFISSDLKD